MKKLLYIVIGFVVLVLLLVAVADASAPEKPDFSPYYGTKIKKPLGLYVLDKEAENLFSGGKVTRIKYTLGDYLDSVYDYSKNRYIIKGTLLKISGRGLDDDDRTITSLLDFAAAGNTVMLCTPHLPQELTDSLGLSVIVPPSLDGVVDVYIKGHAREKFRFDKGHANAYFNLAGENDSVKILGYQTMGKMSVPNFVEARYGSGRILLNTQPAAFSNYYLLKGNHYKYAEAVASAVPAGDVYWQIANAHRETERGLLDYFLAQPAFRAFWYLGLLTLLLFIFFNARRRQRVVPIVPPVTNTTVDFARTIGNLYYREGNHDTIIEKKIIYFLEHIRREYFIDTYELNAAFVEKLHAKTGKPKADILTVTELIKRHRLNLGSSETDVIAINNAIEKLRL
jgi:hypothetical protein